MVLRPTATPKMRAIGPKVMSQKERKFKIFGCHGLNFNPITLVLKFDLPVHQMFLCFKYCIENVKLN